jgi:hypothetical protein
VIPAVLALLVLSTSGLVIIEVREYRRAGRSWCQVQLGFGRETSPEAALSILSQLAGISRGRTVALRIEATHGEIKHYLEADQATLDNLKASLPPLLPSLRLEPVDLAAPSEYSAGRAIKLRGRLRVLRDEEPARLSAALLGSLQPLGKDERLTVRWLVGPARPAAIPTAQGGTHEVPAEHRRVLKAKNDGAVVTARGWIAVRAGHPKRAAHLLGRVCSVLRGRDAAYGRLRFSPRRGNWLHRSLTARHLLLPDRYAAGELVGLLGWPLDSPSLPGLTLGTAPLLMPSPRLPRSGRVVGTATWPGMQRPVAQPVKGALSHSLIAGPTGTGKSTLLMNVMRADLEAGRGLVLVDGKGDTAGAILSHVPTERWNDVIVLDCAAGGKQPGIRLFGRGQPELAADVVLGVFADLFQDSWGPLSERYLRAGLVAIANDPKGTLADLPFVFSDGAYRRRLLGRIKDPLTKATFAAFEAMGENERVHQLSAALNKLGALLGRPIVRTVLGQPRPKLDFREVLARRQIVVISLAPAAVGGPAARLIGALSVFTLFQAVQARGSLAEAARQPFMVYLDEPKALGALPIPLDLLLEQARGLAVGVTLAPQAVTQLSPAVREATLTNAATRIAFRQAADDARMLARDLRGVSAEDLTELGAHEVVARIGLGPGDVAPPVTLKTAPPPKPIASGEQLAERAAERWGMTLAEVDAALEARHTNQAPVAPVGRRRRSV